jgi:ubiquinone/menaquinone biosynthesis C-methylase UbiE
MALILETTDTARRSPADPNTAPANDVPASSLRLPRFPLAHLLGAVVADRLTRGWMPRTPEPMVMFHEDQVRDYTDSCRRMPSMRATHLHLVTQAARALPRAGRILDLACGSAQFLCELAAMRPELTFIGIDLSESMLALAENAVRKRGLTNVTFRRGDITRLPFANASIDGVVSTVALHHLPTREHLSACFRDVARVLRPDGALFLADLVRPRREASVRAIAALHTGAPASFILDTVLSVRAAFLASEFRALADRWFADRRVQIKGTPFGVGLMILQTPALPETPHLEKRLRRLLCETPPAARRVYTALRVMYELGRIFG